MRRSDSEENSILKEAKDLGKAMDLNIVRLKFTAYLQDSNGGFTRALKPVVSNAIYDSSECESSTGGGERPTIRLMPPLSRRVSERLQPEDLPDG